MHGFLVDQKTQHSIAVDCEQFAAGKRTASLGSMAVGYTEADSYGDFNAYKANFF